jgi:hypothetical protein
MRFFGFFIALAVAACATAPMPDAPLGQSAQPAAVSPPPRSRTAQLLAAAGGANAPSEEEVRRALGEPAIARRDGAGAALTYRFEQCGLLLLFQRDSQNTLRLAEAHPSARRAGASAPDLDACVAEAR